MMLVLLPALSHAQDSEDGSASDTQTSISISPSDVSLNVDTCDQRAAEQEFTLSGTYNNPSFTVGYTTRLIATTGTSCSHEDVCNQSGLDDGSCSCLKEVSGAFTLSVSFTVENLFDTPCTEGEERTVSFFLHYAESEADPLIGLNPQEIASPAVRLAIDLNPPAAPAEAPSIVPAEEALVITAPEVGGDVVRYEACVWADGLSRDEARCQSITEGSGERFEGLMNDVLYHVIYAVYDDVDNRSDDSPDAQGTPASVLDFAEVYSGEYPGGERGGCQSKPTQTSMWLVLFMFGLMVLIRKNYRVHHNLSSPRSLMSLLMWSCVVMSLTLTVGNAWSKPLQNQSSMTSTVTLMGGAYQPSIDEEFLPRDGVQRPYERVFQDQSPVMFILQVERHIFQDKGILSVGGGLGYWNVEGDGLSVTTVTESTEMSITPYSVYGAYRFDLFKDTVPVVPTLKLGLNYYTWSIYDGGGDIASFVDGSEASGGTFGWFYSLGAHFLLDFLDQEMAWAFDRDAGVNHSYLSFEYQSSQVDDFGDPNSFRLGNDIFLFGITLDL
jgi:hypothetical protein